MDDFTTPTNSSVLSPSIAEIAGLYLVDLGLSWDELRGKTVLDLGAGLGEFARAARVHGIDVTSLELRPELWSSEGEPPTDIPYVIADAVKLPFDDESFDVVVSRQGPLGTEEDQQRFTQMMHEAIRVLRPGGELRFGPTPVAPTVAHANPSDADSSLDGLTLDERILHLANTTRTYLLTTFKGLEARPIPAVGPDASPRECFVFQKNQMTPKGSSSSRRA